ncbi:hypothetical protein C8P68_11076 [Mucilaginibacter yixingensis]|uniref:Uncharacterized protein n=1 Tax=Mucilaginibacter yixingensis TaxID=1295612 RepID=A0A2T5J5B5_9SPHI|nr:hypothetical protein [Mucilaginibacter yixingensis]PTQ92945.1 hypothetical protein C8P68_11076 [Mucilaginibacter yixingensis]
MTTFTVQINDNDAEMVLAILKKFKAKVIKTPDESSLTYEIAEALKEAKQIKDGDIKPLTLKDI